MVTLLRRWLEGSLAGSQAGFMLAAVLSCSAISAVAWNASGHMQISVSAFDRLEPQLQDRVVALLRQHPRYRQDFLALMPLSIREASDSIRGRWLVAFAGTWPDVARNFVHVSGRKQREQLAEKYNRPRWHYINRPVFLTPEDRKALAPKIRPEPIHWQAERPRLSLNLLQALDFLMQTQLDPDTTASEQGLYLSWILHLVADLHQPLHDASLYARRVFPRGDRGGNDLLVEDDVSLHWLWDSALGKEENVNRLPPMPLPARASGENEMSLERIDLWSQTAHHLAASRVYTAALRAQIKTAEQSPVRLHLTTGYREQMRQLASAQARLASLRLEKVLRWLLAGSSKPSAPD